MVAGGRPLWYLELFTTFSTLFLTLFFAGICLSWSSGLAKIVDDPQAQLANYPSNKRHQLAKYCNEFKEILQGGTLISNMVLGLLLVLLGSTFGYLLHRERAKLIYSKIWFAIVSSYTLVWMVTSIVFYTELAELAGRIGDEFGNEVPVPLNTINKWGKDNSTSTVIGLVIWPTLLFLFLSFAAYRLYIKLSVFGNHNPERIATENTPGSWFARQSGAEGGTWERESALGDPLVKAQAMQDDFPSNGDASDNHDNEGTGFAHTDETKRSITQVHAPGQVEPKPLRSDSVTSGWGTWLEDVFDYTF